MTNVTLGGAPTAGWYTDPQQPANERWWDGGAWTAQTRTVVPVMPPPSVAPTVYAVSAPAQPAPRKKLAYRAAGFGMLGVLLSAIGFVLVAFVGMSPLSLALILGGAIVFVLALIVCIVFSILRI